MSIEEKVQEVEAVFRKLESAVSLFQAGSGIFCPPGCGKCCFKADIEATILEFLPFALHVYREGAADQWMERLGTREESLCALLDPQRGAKGLCTDYAYRGLICRLFGYSTRTNKYGKRELVTCHTIKTEQQDNYEKAAIAASAGEAIPGMNEYYMQLFGIDADLGRDFFPINLAMQKAIETVIHYYEYRTAT